MDYCKQLDYLESLFSRMKTDLGHYSVLHGPGGINEHKRQGHEGKPCPDPENLLYK
jgi:hypothetical protein